MAEQYLPLYRKYRPQEFSDLVGQDNLVKAFTNALNTGKIAHAYLFCGPRGTGKTSSARILAKSLNCQNGPTLTPCGKCPSCLDIINGNMLDVIEMDAASNRSVEDAQNIIDKIHYAPVNGKYKIFIIDEVHMISKTAFNALLKTLEEPPENVIFILATTEPQKVLETIISRCQRFDFRRITSDDIVKRLKFISQKEDIKITDEALIAIAKNSQGGMRDALALLDQISVLDNNTEITADKVNEILGKIDNETLYNIAEGIFKKDVDATVQTINNIYSKGNEPLQIIENLMQYFRNLSVVKTCKDKNTISKLTLLSDDSVLKMKEQVKAHTISELSEIIEKLTYYYKEIKFTNNRYLWLELCFIDISSQKDLSENKPVVKEAEKEEVKISKPIQPVEAKEVKQEQAPVQEVKEEEEINPEFEKLKTETTEEVKDEVIKETEEPEKSTPDKPIQPAEQTKKSNSSDEWKDIISLIESLPSRSFFNTFAKPVELSSSKIVINFKDENFGKKAKESQKLDAFKMACIKYYNVPKIEIEIKTGNIQPQTKADNVVNTSEKKNDDISNSDFTTVNSDIDERETKTTDIAHMEYINKNEYSDQVKMAIDLFDAKVFN